MNAFQQMRRGDVGEIEWRILPEQYDVERRERLAPRRVEREMIAGLVAHGEALNRRHQLLATQRQFVRRVVGNAMTTPLRFKKQRERRIRRRY